ncbi:MAG: hypothetical protein A2W85_00905 [Bacteroidetes bacterium GWF2_41_31]|nr:MAG: hypothetical protein A2W85_00905 [Bacteroidetes bacterium GWF2_41_31]
MRIKKKHSICEPPVLQQTNNDLFLRRIQVQNTIIKKMLSEIDLPSKVDADQKPVDKINNLYDEQESDLST